MGELNQRILRLAIPNVLAAISVPLIGIVDTAMIGHLPEVAFLGAVATASVIFDVLFWSAGFLRMGTTSLVAQYFGAGQHQDCITTLWRALVLGLGISILVLLCRDGIAWVGFELAGGTPEVKSWGLRYFEVRIWGVPFVLALIALNGFFLGTTNALAPMYITFLTNIVNIAADYALIFGHWGAPALGVEGAAWAAVAANGLGVMAAGFILLIKYRSYLRGTLRPLFSLAPVWHLLQTNVHLFGRTLCLLVAQFSMLGLISRMGEIPLAAHAVLWQIWALVSFGVDGFAHAAEILVGNLLGQRDFSLVRRICWRIMLWGIGIGVVFMVLYALGLESLARGFTKHTQVVACIASMAWIVAWIQPLNAVVFVFDGIFIGANDVAYMFKAMLIAVLGLYTPLALLWVFWLDGGLISAWCAYQGLMIGRFLTLLHRYRSDGWLQTFIK